MIHSIIPNELIFPSEETTDFVEWNGIFLETENGRIRRIISTNPSDYLTEIQDFAKLQQTQKS